MRVVIAEDSVLLRAGLTKLLAAAGIEVLAAVGDAEELLAAVLAHQPDVVIADVRMPPGYTDEGIRAALVIRSQWPGVAVLVLSQYVEERYAADLLSANTSSIGYLLKDRVADVGEFLDALRRVAEGGTALDPEVVAQLLLRRRSDPLDRLTPRELEVLRRMAEGRSNAAIAAAAGHHRQRRGQAHQQHLLQARPASRRRGPSPGAGRPAVPGRRVSVAAPPRPRRRWIWVIVALLTALVFVPPFALRIGLKIDIQHQSAPVPVAARPVTALQVDAPAGSVIISPGTGRRVTMSATAAWLVRRPVVTQAWDGSTLRVTAACPRLNPFEDCQEGLVIHVPAGLTVRVSVGSGSVSAVGLTGPLHLTGDVGRRSCSPTSGGRCGPPSPRAA